MKISRLSNLHSDYGLWTEDLASGIPVYHVSSQHVLIQAAGYLKYVLAKESICGVFFRGQSKLYPSLEPSLYRRAKTQKQKQKRDLTLQCYLQASQGNILKDVPEFAQEPLLQHYGIRTRWIDLVDNIWVALWFACHVARATGSIGEYLHFERRRPNFNLKAVDYAYILMVRAGTEVVNTAKPGLYSDGTTELIDLRIAAPSTFLRPHAQHSLLLRRSKNADHKNMDYAEFVVGVIRIQLRDALDWLGEGGLTSTHALFPPPTYDFGYRQLLKSAPPGNDVIAGINLVGA